MTVNDNMHGVGLYYHTVSETSEIEDTFRPAIFERLPLL